MTQHWLYPFRDRITSIEVSGYEAKVAMSLYGNELNLNFEPDELAALGILDFTIFEQVCDPVAGIDRHSEMNVSLTFELRHGDNRLLLSL